MKVTLIYSKNLTDPTGASAVMRFLKEGKKWFKDNNVDMSYLTRDDIFPKANGQSEVNKNISIKGLLINNFMRLLKFLSKKHPKAALLHKYVRSGRAAKVIIKNYQEKAFKSDIVFMHEIGTCYEYIKTREDSDKTKIVLMVHDDGTLIGTDLLDYPSLKCTKYLNKLNNYTGYILNNIDKLGFVSHSSMSNFSKLYPDFPKDKLFYNLNGIPNIESHSQSKSIDDTFRICCIGTVNERKGQRLLVEAMKELSPTHRDCIHIEIVGDGEILEELRTFCNLHNLSNNISFLGKRSDIPVILSNNDIFILPSNSEGLPISILEAMRQGLPIVSTKVGGIPELIIEGKTGLFIDPTINGVKHFLMNLNKYNWKEMGIQSRKLFDEKFSLQSMVNGYAEIFHKVAMS